MWDSGEAPHVPCRAARQRRLNRGTAVPRPRAAFQTRPSSEQRLERERVPQLVTAASPPALPTRTSTEHEGALHGGRSSRSRLPQLHSTHWRCAWWRRSAWKVRGSPLPAAPPLTARAAAQAAEMATVHLVHVEESCCPASWLAWAMPRLGSPRESSLRGLSEPQTAARGTACSSKRPWPHPL